MADRPGLPQPCRNRKASVSRQEVGDREVEEGMKGPAVLRRLKALEEAGLIEWSGKSKKDPRASWKIGT